MAVTCNVDPVDWLRKHLDEGGSDQCYADLGLVQSRAPDPRHHLAELPDPLHPQPADASGSSSGTANGSTAVKHDT